MDLSNRSAWWLSVVLCCVVSACGDSGSGSGGNDGTGGTGGQGALRDGTGFVFSSFGFLYPEDQETMVNGFDLDGVASMNDEGEDCPHLDFRDADDQLGVDYGLIDWFEKYEQLQQGQLVDTVVDTAVKNGQMSIVMEVTGLDDPMNDDEVTVQIFSTLTSPLVGTDGEVLPDTTFAVHPEDRFHSQAVTGSLVDGVLEAGPFDMTIKFNIMIVDSDLTLSRSFIRLNLAGDTASGVIAGHWAVEEIDRIIGTPTTENGNAAGFDYPTFLTDMEAADADYNADTDTCESFTTVFDFDAVSAFITN